VFVGGRQRGVSQRRKRAGQGPPYEPILPTLRLVQTNSPRNLCVRLAPCSFCECRRGVVVVLRRESECLFRGFVTFSRERGGDFQRGNCKWHEDHQRKTLSVRSVVPLPASVFHCLQRRGRSLHEGYCRIPKKLAIHDMPGFRGGNTVTRSTSAFFGFGWPRIIEQRLVRGSKLIGSGAYRKRPIERLIARTVPWAFRRDKRRCALRSCLQKARQAGGTRRKERECGISRFLRGPRRLL
jgi:hypothetical protein